MVDRTVEASVGRLAWTTAGMMAGTTAGMRACERAVWTAAGWAAKTAEGWAAWSADRRAVDSAGLLAWTGVERTAGPTAALMVCELVVWRAAGWGAKTAGSLVAYWAGWMAYATVA